jgi:hypothetical protein
VKAPQASSFSAAGSLPPQAARSETAKKAINILKSFMAGF